MGLHILIADQHAEDLQLVGQYLMRAGHSVESCADGHQVAQVTAYQKQQNNAYDVILLRDDLPGPGTAHILSDVRQYGVNCPAMVMYDPIASMPDHDKLIALNCTAYLKIPLDLQDVQERIDALAHAKEDPFTQNFIKSTDRAAQYDTDRYAKSPKHRSGIIQDELAGSGSTTGRSRKPTTQRIRRSVTGRTKKPETDVLHRAQPTQTHTVCCAHCQQTFRVPVRSEAFNVACIHCGQLNRIMPPNDEHERPT